MTKQDRATGREQRHLRVGLVWTRKAVLGTGVLVVFGLLGPLVIAIGIGEHDLFGMLLGAAITLFFGGTVAALAVQRCRRAPVLELDASGVRGYSYFPWSRRTWQLRWDEVALLSAFDVKTGPLAKYRYLVFLATEESRMLHSRPNGSPSSPELWFSVTDSGWSSSVEEVVRFARQFRPELEFGDTRGT